MSNNYYDMTGELVLSQVTPVIKALFEDFALVEKNFTGEDIYIAQIAENHHSSWDNIRERVISILEDGLVEDVEDEFDVKEILRHLLTLFGNGDETLKLIESIDDDEDPDLAVLFEIATLCNDGHDLKAVKYQGCWHSDKPRLYEFGGDSGYIGRSFKMFGNSNSTMELGADIDQALTSGNLEEVAQLAVQTVNSVLSSISSHDTEDAVRDLIVKQLSTQASEG